MKPGLYTISAAEYHRDPADEPSLSSSIAHLLYTSSPAHARAAHPRLNPQHERGEEEKFAMGTVAHAMLLEGRDCVELVEKDDWRTKAAQQARAEAIIAGKTPLLTKHYERVCAMVDAIRARLDAIECEPGLLVDGKPEQTLIWEDDGIMCRALFDWLHDDRVAVDDLKTTSKSASPEQWSRTLFTIGADIQVAFYLRGLEKVFGVTDVEWRFVVAETYPPYAVSVMSLGPDVLAVAEAKVAFAIRTWRECMESGEWPAYPSRVCTAELPPWEEARFLEREMRDAA